MRKYEPGRMVEILLVAGGGSVVRYLIGGRVQHLSSPGFPWETFFVSVTGSFLIGVVLALFDNSVLSDGARHFLAVGALGGYTTFSTFSLETLRLVGGGAQTGGGRWASLGRGGPARRPGIPLRGWHTGLECEVFGATGGEWARFGA